MRFFAVLWRDYLVFKSKFISVTLGAMIGPFLYLLAFGWGLGSALQIDGISYIVFVIPGIVAMNSMTNSFSFIATDINLSRLYTKTFEALMISPIHMLTFTAAKISAGALRGLYSALLILGISFAFQQELRPDWYFVLVLLLNCYVFSSIGFIAGLLINSHAGVAKASNFVITPMSFLCGTFFPLEKFPPPLKAIIQILPLTQTVKGLRSCLASSQEVGRLWIVPLVLCGYLILLIPVAALICKRAE
jgi:Nod factor-specific ABC transporter NodJ protein